MNPPPLPLKTETFLVKSHLNPKICYWRWAQAMAFSQFMERVDPSPRFASLIKGVDGYVMVVGGPRTPMYLGFVWMGPLNAADLDAHVHRLPARLKKVLTVGEADSLPRARVFALAAARHLDEATQINHLVEIGRLLLIVFRAESQATTSN